MWEWPLVFLAGFLGSSHCLGMCGPFALAIGGRRQTWKETLLRQGIYTSGRLFTYAFLGAMAGFAGAWLAHYARPLVNVSAWLAVAAGLLLLYQGLKTAGVLPNRVARRGKPCVTASLFANLLTGPGRTGLFVAGLATGFLPCALLYGMLALSATTHHLGWGAAVMVVFGLGTAPAMVALGAGSHLLSLASRRRLLHFAAWCVVLTGTASIARGVSYLSQSSPPGTADACPYCQ